jgi:hypothetical protein
MVVVVVVVVFCYTRGLISVVLFVFFCPLLVICLFFLAIAFARIVQRHRKIMKRRLRVKDYIVQDLSLYEDDAEEEEEDFQEEGSTLMGGGRRSVPRRSLTTPAPPPPRAPPPPGTPPPPKGRSTHSRADRLHVLRMQRKRGIAHNADARSELSEFM